MFPQMFAAAAVLVFAVVLVPLFQQADSLNQNRDSGQLAETAATQELPVASQIGSADSVEQEAESSSLAVANAETDSVPGSERGSATDSLAGLADDSDQASTVASLESPAPDSSQLPTPQNEESDAGAEAEALNSLATDLATLDADAEGEGVAEVAADAGAVTDTEVATDTRVAADVIDSSDVGDVSVLSADEKAIAPVVDNSPAESAMIKKQLSAIIQRAKNPRTTTISTEESSVPEIEGTVDITCLLYTSPSPRDATLSRMPSSA